jgi:glutamate 5-kinase
MSDEASPVRNPAGSSSASSIADLRRALLGAARCVVVKIGSRLLAESPAARPATMADEIAYLGGARDLRFVVVSSGAIALGSRVLGLAARPTDLPGLQAAAAVGQGRLLQHWEHAFAVHDRRIGQLLLTHDDIADRKRFLNARHTLRALLDLGVVPIINENDSVAIEEIKYGDNDLLAALVCNLISADVLIMMTDVEGLRDAAGVRIAVVQDIDREAAPVAGASSADRVGSGGMASKVQAAKAAARSGVPTLIVPGRDPRVLARALGGDDVGTLFLPADARMSSRKHWIAYSSKPVARLVVDEGAYRALVQSGKSLLPAGVVAVQGSFDLGDVVSLVTVHRTEFARGLAGYRSEDVERIRGLHTADIEPTLGYKYLDEIIHRDDLVLL